MKTVLSQVLFKPVRTLQQMTKVAVCKKKVNMHIYIIIYLHCRLGLNVFTMARDFWKEDRYKVHKRFLLRTKHLCQEMLTIKRADFSIKVFVFYKSCFVPFSLFNVQVNGI